MSNHMCSLIKKDLQKEKPEEFKKLIKNAKFYCKKCGRVAIKNQNLCKPQDF